ncbi:sigma 54-interacting transcriptional regulator [Lutispora thermophila]|uniref:PAS domain S-box-containing protein n=1 Tax=Lutispora thermophila DSM 19022 TaxID=1122184 RepID=A0A1M6GTZ2_9FIRM|nr:sigma 54-interacting transcriptional regulator [Lutispora thermophila]SHJ13436.1 PAS domain S-box-containing protein [Lutispora thermophila DSM 19022]
MMFFDQSMYKCVSEVMDKDIIKTEYGISIDCAVDMMLSNARDEVIITRRSGDKEYVEGILTKTDICRLKKKKVDFAESVKKYMRTDVYTIMQTEKIKQARDIMMSKGIGRLLVTDGYEITGVITSKSLLNTYYLEIEELMIQLSIVLENLQEAVCVVSSEGIVRLWNKSSVKLYGIEKSEIIGRNIKEVFPNALLAKALEEKKSFVNHKHKPKEGSYVVISAVPLMYDGKIIGAVSTDRDITEIKNLSMQLESERSKVEFLEEQMKNITQAKYSFGSIIGKSKAIVNAITLAKQVAKSNASILITGESGTGKEVFARAIHQESGRLGHFVPINCSAIPYNLFESELFGYAGGAFTGALKKGKIGKFELADGGTLFLDEIGDMPIDMQAKLLRVLQDGVITKVGGDKSINVDVRILAATNKDLKKMMLEGTFREDLYYRLCVVSIHLPPLRERKEDLPELIRSFVAEFAEYNEIEEVDIEPEVIKALTDYEWKGNIRELRNVVERLIILSPDGKIRKDMLPDDIIRKNSDQYSKNTAGIMNSSYDLKEAVANIEKRTIIEVMNLVEGNKAKAAQMLNINRGSLYYKLKQYGLEEYL